MRVLVVEDDEPHAEIIARGLRKHAFAVDVAIDGEQALFWAETNEYDVIVLDVMLPQVDGLEVCRRLRANGSTTSILMLTARDGVADRVEGLETGADDYLVKPFDFAELLARIEVLLRRAAGAAPAPDALLLSLGDLQVDLARRRAVRAGQRLELSAKEFQLLTLLMRRKGEVLSRTEIAEQVWDVNFDHGTNVIDVAIRRLRGKLDLPFEHPLLHTVRGMGYVLEDRSP